MKWIFKLLGLVRFHSSWYIKNKYGWLGSLIYPFSFYVILSVVGGAKISEHAIVGALIALLWMSGVGSMPQIFFSFKFAKLKDMFVAAPIHPIIYMFGASLSVLVASLPPMAVFLVLLVASIKITMVEVLSLTLVLFGAWLISTALGFVVAGYVKDPTRIGTIAPWTGALLISLPPVYYPLEILPAQYRFCALIAPTTHIAELAKISIKITSPSYDPLLHVLAMFAYFIAFILLAAFKSRWREK